MNKLGKWTDTSPFVYINDTSKSRYYGKYWKSIMNDYYIGVVSEKLDYYSFNENIIENYTTIKYTNISEIRNHIETTLEQIWQVEGIK